MVCLKWQAPYQLKRISKKRFLTCFMFVFVLYMPLYLWMAPNCWTAQLQWQSPLQNNFEEIRFNEAGEIIYETRKRYLQNVCSKDGDRYLGSHSAKIVNRRMVYDKEHNFVYCPIPKVGTTLMKRVIQVMTGISHEDDPYKIPGRHAHTVPMGNLENMEFYEIHRVLRESTKLMIVRNPYSRLLSAYVSKLFFPFQDFWEKIGIYTVKLTRGKKITNGHKCGHDVTFPEFVKYVIDSFYTKSHSDPHFEPMYEQCRPCQIQYDIIAKMETFSDDLLYVLEKVNASDLKFVIAKGNKSSRLVDEFNGRSKWIFQDRERLTTCMSFFDVQRRVWKSLQIRGLISKNSKYPFSEQESAKITEQDFAKALHDAVGDTKDAAISARYRQEAEDEAYGSLGLDDMKKLREIFRPDCELFQYECSPPRYFDKSSNEKNKLWYLDTDQA